MPRKNGHKANLEHLLTDVKAVVRDGQDLLRTSANELKAQAGVRARSTDHLVRSYPYRTLGMAFGLGLLAGLLLACRSGGEAELELRD